MYLTATHPDIMFSVSLISRYMAKPTELHLQAAKRIMRYLKGTANYGILYKKGGRDEELLAFTDSDYAGDVEDRKSTSRYVFLLSLEAVSWLSKKQPIVTMSTTEAKFVAAAAYACQAVWMRWVLKRLSHAQEGCTTIMCNNSSAIKLSRNPVMHGSRSKCIDVRFHFLRDLTKEGEVELVHGGTQEQVADLMTKPLKLEAFQKLRKMMGVCKATDVN
ncbi:secreted RxLR effector protein 161-like [Rosa rugosa]|uniref:secreted RxLR effector protein 161-like n=1 Tax=Rosa rugosa TaxID=74645 RepID=UPI002B409A05|nr:secreted RxLR effector protein 161-like [Rosa rugosa]